MSELAITEDGASDKILLTRKRQLVWVVCENGWPEGLSVTPRLAPRDVAGQYSPLDKAGEPMVLSSTTGNRCLELPGPLMFDVDVDGYSGTPGLKVIVHEID